MSDISIPGVKSKYDTAKIIEGLMAVERIPLTRSQARLEEIRLQRTVWLDLNRRMSSLRESARSLFSFQNPFNERTASSSDESVLTGTATREAIEETKSFIVKRTASADRFMSDAVPADAKVPKGEYSFSVGDKTIRLSYGGGSIKDFADAINRKGAETVRAQLVAIRPDERVLVIESLKTGKDNRLGFGGAAEDFALSVGLVEKASSTLQALPTDNPVRFDQPLDASKAFQKDGALYLAPGAEAALKLPSPSRSEGLVLELEVELRDLPGGQAAPVGPPPGPAIPSTGTIEYEGIRIASAPSEAELPAWSPPPTPPRRDDLAPLYLIDGSGRSVRLPEVRPGDGFKTITVPLPAYVDSFSGVGLRNGNTGRELRVRSARVYDPTETAGLRPKNPVQTAGDAVVVMDGIEVTRSDNAVSDLVPGLTINLWQASDKPVKLKVEPDREAAKEAVIELVGNYNRLMAELNILARKDESVLAEIEYFTADEKKAYAERLGLFQGDTTLSQLRTSMQRTMMDAYPTGGGMSQLAAFGITTDSRRGGSYDAARLRGYLEIDESALDKALQTSFGRVKDLFGFDSDGDLLMDAGAAFKLDAMMKAYVETGGVVTTRTTTLDSQISRQQKEIETLEDKLAKKEAELKRQYGQMEGALGQMESTSSAWDTFNSSQGK